VIPKSSLSISESDLREVSAAVFGAFHHYLGVGVGEPEALPSSYSGRASHPGCPLVHGPFALACDSYLIYGQRMLAMEGTIDSECEYADPCKGHGRLIISDEGVRWERPRLLANRAHQAPGWHATQMGS